MRHRAILTIIFGACALAAHAQGPVKKSLSSNIHAKARVEMSAIASTLPDTLHLPFFDDFAYKGPNPIDSLWLDDDVFINNTFTNDQITRGVATFDHLDANGTPYDFLSRFASSKADTLTSQCINLKNDRDLNNYVIGDSIYLSFYVQTGGLGDVPEAGDSLLLQFKNTIGDWTTVWNITGNAASIFKQFFVGIDNADYLFNTFQFRFINYVKNSGNMNHFHLDYVELNEERSVNEVRTRAIAFAREPKGLLAPYSILPYDHFSVNPTSYMSASSSRSFYMRNNSQNATALVLYDVEAKDEQNTSIYSFLATNASNIPPQSTLVKTIDAFPLTGLTGDTPIITTKYTFLPNSTLTYDSVEQQVYNNFNNNSVEKITRFHHFYAYDDGSAEVGYALDYSGLPSGPGYTVVGFNLAKTDTLQGVDIHFNRAFEEVGNRPIKLQFWQQIANGAGKTDQLIYEIEAVPTYVNGRNGFARFELDTLIILPAGEFFVGWEQNSDFKINVGWDENYDQLNTHIFYNLTGTWAPLPNGFNGTLMIRPLIGKPIIPTVSVANVDATIDFNVYPNPSNGHVNISSNEGIQYQIFDLTGKLIVQSMDSKMMHSLQLSKKGIYICLATSNKGRSTRKIIIK